MLPCLSSNSIFMIELMVVPCQSWADLNYSIVIGQDTMRVLDLNTSIPDNTISWREEQIPMVPNDYWMEECIIQQKALHQATKDCD